MPGDRQHHVFLKHVAAGRARIDASVPRVDDDHWLGVSFRRSGASELLRLSTLCLLRPRRGRRKLGQEARPVSRGKIEVDTRDRRACPTRDNARFHPHRPLGVDDDARLAQREQAVAVGLDEAASLLARTLRQAEAHVGHVDDDPVGVGQQEILVGRGAGKDEREARARLVPADLGRRHGDRAIVHLGRPSRTRGLGRPHRGTGLLAALLDLDLRRRALGRRGLPDLGLGAAIRPAPISARRPPCQPRPALAIASLAAVPHAPLFATLTCCLPNRCSDQEPGRDRAFNAPPAKLSCHRKDEGLEDSIAYRRIRLPAALAEACEWARSRELAARTARKDQ